MNKAKYIRKDNLSKIHATHSTATPAPSMIAIPNTLMEYNICQKKYLSKWAKTYIFFKQNYCMVRAGTVRGVSVDVERHFACHISHGGVLVHADIMEQQGECVGCALGRSALLESDRVEGH